MPFLRFVTTSRGWSMLMRRAQGSWVLSNGPRYTAYSGVGCFSAP